ncbi:hypothetical protein EV356DRAFT_534296 [Viridothelium virens]|uniref:Uncharacterized protein n=1 Tax=Viridothelium virens TaxID=1048519 RepID=A0A6A6H4H5_VIRVR|nr:hypothetical protein EV356DRAFT_534296 [Viridothelium virens]
MAGTVILTDANGSAGLHASEHLLKAYLELAAVFIFRLSSAAGIDMVELAVNKAYDGERGCFILLKKDESEQTVCDEEMQQKIGVQTAKWAKITKDNTALKGL